jgi:hypothetical protein
MYNPSGFDDSDLLLDPEERQRSMPGASQNVKLNMGLDSVRQAQMANTNPMNAVSQEPGKDFLAGYLQKSGPDMGDSAFLNFGGKDSSGMSALEKKELLKKGELTEDMVQGDSVTDKMLLRQLKMQQMGL